MTQVTYPLSSCLYHLHFTVLTWFFNNLPFITRIVTPQDSDLPFLFSFNSHTSLGFCISTIVELPSFPQSTSSCSRPFSIGHFSLPQSMPYHSDSPTLGPSILFQHRWTWDISAILQYLSAFGDRPGLWTPWQLSPTPLSSFKLLEAPNRAYTFLCN
jgi:hypothetical protein